MTRYLLGLTILIIQSTICLSQDNRDYSALNLLIKKYSSKKTLDSSSFITELHFKSNPYEKEDKTKIWKYYLPEINKLINKNVLHEYQSITKRQIKKSFVKWNSNNIDFNRIVKAENDDFFYFTKPIFITNEYFLAVSYFHTKGGGVSITLYKYDETNKTIERVDSHTIMRYGFYFRT